MASRWLVVLLATAVAGCASFKGAPDQSISEDDPNRSIPRTAINTVLKQAVTDIEAKKKFSQEERNELRHWAEQYITVARFHRARFPKKP